MVEFKFEMEEEVKDRISSFSGVILARSEYATGCKHYGVAPKKMSKDGLVMEWQWFDESRLISLSKPK